MAIGKTNASGGKSGFDLATITFNLVNPVSVYYINSSGEYTSEFMPQSITTIKNSIIGVNSRSGNTTGDVTVLASCGDMDGGASCILVTGDGSVEIGI